MLVLALAVPAGAQTPPPSAGPQGQSGQPRREAPAAPRPTRPPAAQPATPAPAGQAARPGEPARPATTAPAPTTGPTTGPAAGTAKPPAARAEGDGEAAPRGFARGVTSPVPNFWDPKRRPERPSGEVGTIRFLTSGDFPPFNFLDSGGRLTGFNVDLARAICEAVDATCTIQMRPFEELANALADRRGDAIIAGMAVSPELRAKLETSEVYLTTPGRFVAPKGTGLAATPEGLELRWISVVSGSAHEAFVLDNFPRSRVVAYPNEASARDALRDGTVDVHFGDAVGLSFWIAGEASHGCCAFRGEPYLDRSYFGDGFRIAFGKGNKRLKQVLDYALQKLSEDGTVAELYFRYFPLGYY